jgi:hypothetical protein
MTEDWNHGLMMIRRSWGTNESQRQEVKMILKHMAIGNYKQFKFFHTQQHAKHGGDLKDKREKAT